MEPVCSQTLATECHKSWGPFLSVLRPPFFLQALEKYCRTEAGFSGIQDVYSSIPNHDNKQQSFFLAETLK
jgi:hypothetical protein